MFSVEVTERGIIVTGPVPCDALGSIAALGEGRGFTIFDAAIGRAIGATLVLTSPEHADKWRAEINVRAAMSPDGDSVRARAARWLKSTDTGLSSEALLRELLGEVSKGNTPFDDDDVGRCVRMLDLFPEFKGWETDETVKLSPGWEKIRPYWKAIEKDYRDGGRFLVTSYSCSTTSRCT